MKAVPRQLRKAARSKPVISGVLLGLYVFVLAMAQFGALHQALHADACEPEHQCAVTLLSSGQVDVAADHVRVAIAPLITISALLPEAPLPVAAEYSLLPSRGPPAHLS